MLIDKVKETIIQNNLIEKGEHIVLGLSGGPDSVCLFHILVQLAQEWDLTLHAVHVNHQLRGIAADGDQAYAEELCAAFEVPCHVFACDVATLAKAWGMTTEEAGRKVRYQAFDEVRHEILTRRKGDTALDNAAKGVKIAVAQNLNDQVETVLMRVLRGTGIDGLAGMSYMRDHVFIRPLLDATRGEIEEYCANNNLNPRTDLSNLEPVYTRNKIRLELIPYLEKNFNPGILKALNRLSKSAAEDKDYLGGSMPKRDISPTGARCTFLLSSLRSCHPAVRKRAVTQGFKEIGLTQDIAAVHLDAADKLIEEGTTSEQIDFPGGYVMRISYDRVVLFQQREATESPAFLNETINIKKEVEIPALNGILRVRILKNDKNREMGESSACLDLRAVENETEALTLRTRRPGDFIVPLGMNGTKKLQDFFVDAKVQKEKRDRIPLVCIGSEVLWVPGHRINEKYKVKKETEDILFLEYDGIL